MARKTALRQPYPRQENLLANNELFPIHSPPLTKESIQLAIRAAFERTKKSKRGGKLLVSNSPQKLVNTALTHIHERNDPIIGTSFYSGLPLNDVFQMDAIPHEIQRYRMKMGVFYQYLIIELIQVAINTKKSSFVKVFDGVREGDVVADVITPSYNRNLRIYMSVKKSIDTVGGQDIGGAIDRLEKNAKLDKNLTSPYLCVMGIATPPRGKILSYNTSRNLRYNQHGFPYSENCEVWLPGFIFPYITGWGAMEIYKEAVELVDTYLPFYTLKYQKECAELLKQKFIEKGIVDSKTNELDKQKFFEFICGK